MASAVVVNVERLATLLAGIPQELAQALAGARGLAQLEAIQTGADGATAVRSLLALYHGTVLSPAELFILYEVTRIVASTAFMPPADDSPIGDFLGPVLTAQLHPVTTQWLGRPGTWWAQELRQLALSSGTGTVRFI